MVVVVFFGEGEGGEDGGVEEEELPYAEGDGDAVWGLLGVQLGHDGREEGADLAVELGEGGELG